MSSSGIEDSYTTPGSCRRLATNCRTGDVAEPLERAPLQPHADLLLRAHAGGVARGRRARQRSPDEVVGKSPTVMAIPTWLGVATTSRIEIHPRCRMGKRVDESTAGPPPW